MQLTTPQVPNKQINMKIQQVIRPYVPMPQVLMPEVQMKQVPLPQVPMKPVPTLQVPIPKMDGVINTKDMVNVLEEIKRMMIDQGDKMANIILEQREMVRRKEIMRNNITEVVRNQEEMKNTMREIMERHQRLEEEIRENIRMMAIIQEMEIMKIEELQGRLIEGPKEENEKETSMTAYTTGYVIITEEMLNRMSEEEMRKMQNRIAKNITTYQQKNAVEKKEQIRKMRENRRIIRGEQEVRRKAKMGVGMIQLQIK